MRQAARTAALGLAAAALAIVGACGAPARAQGLQINPHRARALSQSRVTEILRNCGARCDKKSQIWDGDLGSPGNIETGPPRRPGPSGSAAATSGDMSVKILNSNDARGALDAATSRLDSVPIGADTPAPDNPDLLVVAIRYLKNGAPDLCTGTLIDSKHVLTAGHCACGSNYEIILDDRADNAQVRPITGGPQLFGKDLCRDFRPVGDDLALLTLADPVRCPAVIDARGALSADCRTDAAHAKANAPYRTFGYPQELFYDILPRLERVGRLRAFGYGFTEKGTLGVRMYADIPIESTTCTEREYASECAPYSEIVLGERSGRTARKDTCRGDSGGPVFLVESGRYTLVAVTSRASSARPDDPRLNCGGGGIYTVVSRESVRRWLKANGVDEIQTLTSRAAAGAAASRPR